MSLILLLAGVAAAHPMASNLYGHRLELWLEPGQLRALYVAEVPTATVLRDLRERSEGAPDKEDTEAYVEEREAELLGGLRLLVNGASAPWQLSDDDAPDGEGDARFVSFGLPLVATLPGGARTVQIVNGNLPDEPSLFLVDLSVRDDVVIDDASLLDLGEDGRARRSRSGQWRAEEQSRDLRVSFRPRSPAWTSLLRAGATLSGRGERARWDEPGGRLARASWAGLREPERLALGLCCAAMVGGGTLGGLLGAPRRPALAWLAAGSLGLVCLAWLVTLLIGRHVALCVACSALMGASALITGALRARRPASSALPALLFSLWGLLLALSAGASLFTWGSVQSDDVGENGL